MPFFLRIAQNSLTPVVAARGRMPAGEPRTPDGGSGRPGCELPSRPGQRFDFTQAAGRRLNPQAGTPALQEVGRAVPGTPSMRFSSLTTARSEIAPYLFLRDLRAFVVNPSLPVAWPARVARMRLNSPSPRPFIPGNSPRL